MSLEPASLRACLVPRPSTAGSPTTAKAGSSAWPVRREDCLPWRRQLGWPVAEVYVDNDVSAYSGKPRPAYRRMLRDIKDGTRDALVVYDLDRLVRQPRELEEFFDICDAAGLTSFASVTGDLDLANDDRPDLRPHHGRPGPEGDQ